MLVAIPLIFLSHVNRLRAAGFVAVVGAILIALYPAYVASLWFNGRGWEFGAALWPLGACLMWVSAILAARVQESLTHTPSLTRAQRLIMILLGIALIGASLTLRVEAVAFLFAVGVTAFVGGVLSAEYGDGPVEARSIRTSRWLGGPLLVGSGMILASNFVPWGAGRFPYLPIRLQYLFNPAQDDLWTAILTLVEVAAGFAAAALIFASSGVSHVLIGGATAASIWMLPVVARVVGGEIHTNEPVGPGAYWFTAGVLLVLASAIYISEARRGSEPEPSVL